jgi:hypothetical protein
LYVVPDGAEALAVRMLVLVAAFAAVKITFSIAAWLVSSRTLRTSGEKVVPGTTGAISK